MQEHLYDGSHNLVLHLGVDSSAGSISLEKQAVNLNNFRIPDEEGNQPENEAIDKGNDKTHCLLSKIEIDSMVEILRDGQHNCKASTDAGNYLCNYIYYTSMRELEYVENCDTIFIHVPSFNTLSKEKQKACVNEFIKQWVMKKCIPVSE